MQFLLIKVIIIVVYGLSDPIKAAACFLMQSWVVFSNLESMNAHLLLLVVMS